MKRTFSNGYILLYAALLAIVAGLILTITSVSLKPLQKRNQEVETMQMILRTIGIESSVSTAEALYTQHITEATTQEGAPYYVFSHGIILPLHGTGLWGPIWGYIALDESKTVVGAVFDHKGETPGLGGEIATEAFANRFIGKSCTDSMLTYFVPIVLKKNADKNNPHEVDAISGGTMTSNGVTAMLKDCLSKYQDYMLTNKPE